MNASVRRGIPLRPDAASLEAAQRRSFARALSGMVLSSFGRNRSAEEIIETAWPDDRDAILVTRAAAPPLGTAGFPSITSVAGFALLSPEAAATRLFQHPSTIKLDFAGVAQYSIPHVGSVPEPVFIEEGAPAPVIAVDFDGTACGPTKKLMFLAGLSGELEFATPETASAIISATMSAAAAKALDRAVFSSTPADDTRPPGLFVGASPITPEAGGGSAALVADIAALVQTIADAGISTADLVFVAGPAAATKLKLLASPAFTAPIYECAAMPGDSVAAIAPAGVATGYSGAPEISTTKQGVAHFASPALPIAVPGSPDPVVSAPTYSGFQMGLLLLRVKVRCAWVALPGAVARIDGVTW